MSGLGERYLAIHRQGFMPIFVQDAFDALLLADCAVEAGAAAIEITCRRPAALEEIRAVRRAHPKLIILAGSVVDGDGFLAHVRRRNPAMPSIDQLLEAGVDGIVSALPIRLSTVEHVSRTHLVIPGVETMTEATAAIEAGAQMAKLFTADLVGGAARVARMTCAATHAVLPLFVTGGITLSRIDEYVRAGAAMLGSGWDVLLGEHYARLQLQPDRVAMVQGLRSFLAAMQTARQARPEIWPAVGDEAYLARLPHYVAPSMLGETL